MKKICLLTLCISILLILSACENVDTPFLNYQSEPFRASVSLEINSEKYSTVILKESPEICKMTFESPESLNGIYVEKNGTSLFLVSGDVRAPLAPGSNAAADALSLFELSKDSLISTETSMISGVKVNINIFRCDFGNVKLCLSSENGLPLFIEADINGNAVKMSFSDFCSAPYESENK